MIKEMTGSFIGTFILVAIPAVIILLLYVGLFGKSIQQDTCPCCGQNLSKEIKK